MATKAKANEITVPKSILKQFVDLVEALESADAHYQTCQATLFRSFARDAYQAPNIKAAYEQAKAAIG